MLTEDFFLAFQTHMQRVMRTVEKDGLFITELNTLASANDVYKPILRRVLALEGNRSEALADLNGDVAELMKFAMTVIGSTSSVA